MASKLQGASRVPENVFHLFTILGGIVGQHLGRSMFSHKTNIQRHPSFVRVELLSVFIWAILLFRNGLF